MSRIEARWPICGACCEVAQFSWLGGAHHCVVAAPEQVLDESPLNLRSPQAVTDPDPAVSWQRILHSPAGLVDRVERVNSTRAAIHRDVIHFTGSDSGRRIEVVAQWNAGDDDAVHTFVNSAPTADGGTHRDGFFTALATVLNGFARSHDLITADGPDLTGADFGRGLTAIIAVTSPGFSTDAEAGTFTATVCEEHLTHWLKANPDSAKTIVRKAILSYASRFGPCRSHGRGC